MTSTVHPAHLTSPLQNSGALVISLDFELHWGVRDHRTLTDPYATSLRGGRNAIPEMLRLFQHYGVSATWATVGFLFAKDRDELYDHAPTLRPTYDHARLSPYLECLGAGESDDPLHFAPSLVARIAETPGQEVASHTFSHYYCLESGQTREQFTADLRSAQSLAGARGLRLRSLVLPRNQLNGSYLPVLKHEGFVAYRGNQRHWAFEERGSQDQRHGQRVIRLLDSYAPLTGHHAHRWEHLRAVEGVVDVPASRFLRPAPARLGSLAVRRVVSAMEHAARTRGVFHLWWHPHNFGTQTLRRLAELEQILVAFKRLHDQWGMRSYAMAEIADAVLAA